MQCAFELLASIPIGAVRFTVLFLANEKGFGGNIGTQSCENETEQIYSRSGGINRGHETDVQILAGVGFLFWDASRADLFFLFVSGCVPIQIR